MSTLSKTLLTLTIAICCFGLYVYQDSEAPHDEGVKQGFNERYAIYALPLPEKVSFVGEEVPMNDPEIRERYDREILVNTYWQSQTLLFHKRAARYFPIIEPILKKNNVPLDFKYLAVIESGLTNVVSPAGATGFWQILEGTGKGYGLEINKEVDERYHLEKATQAACDYLKEAHRELGDWTLAAASYNMGINGVKKQLERQKAKNYYGLTLNDETARYVFRIMAVKELLENPTQYGFHFRNKDLYQPIPTTTVEVDTAVSSFGGFAEKMGINYRILKFHNPWLRYDYLPNPQGKTYRIKIPKEGYFDLAREEVNPKPIEENPQDELPISDGE
jgi:hypothetical protein